MTSTASLRRNLGSPDFVAGASFAVFSGLMLVVAYLPHKHSLTSSLDTMYWPRIVLWGLLMVSLILAARPLWQASESAVASPPLDSDSEHWPLTAIVCCTVYLILVGIVGFLLSSLLFGVAFPLLLGSRRWLRAAAFSLTVTAVFWLLVIDLMHVLLPRGVGVFRTFSQLFY